MSAGGRLLPVLLGHDLDDDEEDDANSRYLLQLDDDRPRQASLDAPRGLRQPLLTTGPNEDAAVRLHGEETESDGTVVVGLAVAEGQEEGEGEGGGGALVAEAGGGVVVTTRDGAEEEEQEEFGDVDVVVETRLVSEWTRCVPTPRPSLTSKRFLLRQQRAHCCRRRILLWHQAEGSRRRLMGLSFPSQNTNLLKPCIVSCLSCGGDHTCYSSH